MLSQVNPGKTLSWVKQVVEHWPTIRVKPEKVKECRVLLFKNKPDLLPEEESLVRKLLGILSQYEDLDQLEVIRLLFILRMILQMFPFETCSAIQQKVSIEQANVMMSFFSMNNSFYRSLTEERVDEMVWMEVKFWKALKSKEIETLTSAISFFLLGKKRTDLMRAFLQLLIELNYEEEDFYVCHAVYQILTQEPEFHVLGCKIIAQLSRHNRATLEQLEVWRFLLDLVEEHFTPTLVEPDVKAYVLFFAIYKLAVQSPSTRSFLQEKNEDLLTLLMQFHVYDGVLSWFTNPKFDIQLLLQPLRQQSRIKHFLIPKTREKQQIEPLIEMDIEISLGTLDSALRCFFSNQYEKTEFRKHDDDKLHKHEGDWTGFLTGHSCCRSCSGRFSCSEPDCQCFASMPSATNVLSLEKAETLAPSGSVGQLPLTNLKYLSGMGIVDSIANSLRMRVSHDVASFLSQLLDHLSKQIAVPVRTGPYPTLPEHAHRFDIWQRFLQSVRPDEQLPSPDAAAPEFSVRDCVQQGLLQVLANEKMVQDKNEYFVQTWVRIAFDYQWIPRDENRNKKHRLTKRILIDIILLETIMFENPNLPATESLKYLFFQCLEHLSVCAQLYFDESGEREARIIFVPDEVMADFFRLELESNALKDSIPRALDLVERSYVERFANWKQPEETPKEEGYEFNLVTMLIDYLLEQRSLIAKEQYSIAWKGLYEQLIVGLKSILLSKGDEETAENVSHIMYEGARNLIEILGPLL